MNPAAWPWPTAAPTPTAVSSSSPKQAYDSLDQHYTLFGQCDEPGIQVVKAIARVPRDGDDKPLKPVVLKKVTIVREGQPLPSLPVAAQPASPQH